MVSDLFFKTPNVNYVDQVVEICLIFYDWDQSIIPLDEVELYEEYADAYAALEAFLNVNNFTFEELKLSDNLKVNIQSIRDFFGSAKSVFSKKFEERIAVDSINSARAKYQRHFDIGFMYRFSDGDIVRIQELLNELRNMISISTDFDAKHKERLLNRLESLQKEIHKTMSSIDKFWGLVGDAGVAIGKFGKDAKPMVDRIREITQIIWQVQARAEELPSNTMMPSLSENNPSSD